MIGSKTRPCRGPLLLFSGVVFNPGRQIGGYEIRAILGRGPFGVSMEALDSAGQPVLLKLFHPEFAERAEGKAAFDRLKRAVRAHQKVQHPYVASVSDFVDEPEQRAVGAVCSLHEGFPLEQLEVSTAARRGDDPSELSRLLFFFEELGDALHWLHERRIVHGNLKSGNVLVQRGDFGIIPKILDLSWSSMGVAASAGNIFISPEQFAGQVPTKASDQWAFGMLIARSVGDEDMDVGGAPRLLVEILERMRQRQAGHRFASMKEAVDGLRAVRSDLERARVLSRSARFRQESEGQLPVPSARALGDGESGDLVESSGAAISAVDGRLQNAGARVKEASPLRLAPAALSPRDLEAPDFQLSVHSHRLKPRTPLYLGIAAALVGGALLLGLLYQSGSTVTAEATAEAQEIRVESGEEEIAVFEPPPSSGPSTVTEAEDPIEAAAPAEPSTAEAMPLVGSEPEAVPEEAPRAPSRNTAPRAEDCELGSAQACVEAAGWFADRGRDREARGAYESACDAGRRSACLKAVQWWAGSGLPEAERRTFVLLTKACALGGGQACHLAADRAESGLGIPPDPARALRFRRRACQLGRTAACGGTSSSTGARSG